MVDNSRSHKPTKVQMLLPRKGMPQIGAALAVLLLSGDLLMAANDNAPKVRMETSSGTLVLQLDAENAPVTTENFLKYVDDGFYDGTIFHRVIKGFMIQGGGFDRDFQQKATLPPIENEADNGLKNERGTIAMARTGDPHSATAQFFINSVDNDFLDHRAKNPQGWGYTVFGRVVEGLEVIDAISGAATGRHGPHSDVPQSQILILKAERVED